MLLAAAEQLEKSREIIKRLKEEKKKIVMEMDERLRQAEDNAEVEKDKLVQEVSRGKSAAISLLQVCVCKMKLGILQGTSNYTQLLLWTLITLPLLRKTN